ncbi:MAG: DivIVA domain-containing protein [Actinomycetota bacterium]|nr:DivIVA domain-containing protein [Actinomycetota bacterium]
MELTPDLLETQQFPERFRGYDPDSVDDFLERVAAGLNELQERLDHLADRLMEAEERTVRNDLDGDVEVIDGRLDAIESIREALETAPRFESNEVGQTRIGSMGDIGGPVAVGANKIEIDRIAQLITLARDTADDAIDDAIASTRDQIGDLLADVLVASSTDLAARGATDRKAELETELLELDARVNARRNDAHQLAELIETRRRALGEIARDLGGRPDGLEVDHPASSAEVGGWSTFDDSVNAEDDSSAHRRPATDARSGSKIDDPFFSALQRQQPLEGE